MSESSSSTQVLPAPPPDAEHRLGSDFLRRPGLRDRLLLVAVVLACLLPFSGKAFRIDDPLFVWSAQQITQHPLNPYGFQANWYETLMPVSQITKNPPLGCYYGALIGLLAGWSERAWHLGFLLVTLAMVLGTYRLAKHFTRYPLIASLAALLTPGILVSASGVMCDVMMLAFWVWAAVFWIEGLEPGDPVSLATSAVLIAASALTKYFGAALIPLLVIYSLMRKRRLGAWAWYLAIPVVSLAGYQIWTHMLYGRGLLGDAAQYALVLRTGTHITLAATVLSGVAFVGGCALTGLTTAPALWPRRAIVIGVMACGLLGALVRFGFFQFDIPEAQTHWNLISIQFALFLAGGFSILALAICDLVEARDADSMFLGIWVAGTFVFACFVNWTINARSILPLIPAAAILLARQLERNERPQSKSRRPQVALALVLSGLVSVWVLAADTELANSARTAATDAVQFARQAPNIFFEGHWGFQYYMQLAGARALDRRSAVLRSGDVLVVPEDNANVFLAFPERSEFLRSDTVLFVPLRSGISIMSRSHAAGFYSASTDGPLPFVFGAATPGRYHLYWPLRTIRVLPR